MPTRLIRSVHNLTPHQQGGVLTIGNFDGVHVGHQHLITKTIEAAHARQSPAVLMTFEPHPFEFFAGDNLVIPRITRLREKFCALSACGIENVLILPFNQALANLTAREFVQTIIVGALKTKHIVIGDDFRFGYQRQGDFALLEQMGKEYGFTVQPTDTVMVDNERVSSTRVRQALAQGDHELIKRLLGHPYTMLGRVRLGDQRGRQWGFPTANIYLHRRLTPVKGVYTVYMHGITPKPLPGVANVGTRPTIDGTKTLLEVHLLNFNQDIYGRYVEIEFCKKLRDEKRYANFDLLKEQIANDVITAKHYFKDSM